MLTAVTENTEEIVGTIANLQKSLGKDGKEMCDLVLCLREDFDGKLGFNQLFNDCCLGIYWSLKLHLKFHCTDVSGHERLRELHLFFKPRKLTIFLLKNLSRILEVRS